MLKLLGIDVNKWVIYIAGFLIIAAMVVGGYLYWKHNVTTTAQLKFNNQQLEQTVKDQEAFIAQTKALSDIQNQLVIELNDKNVELSGKLIDIDNFLNSPEAEKTNRESSDVIKETIKRLKAVTGQ